MPDKNRYNPDEFSLMIAGIRTSRSKSKYRNKRTANGDGTFSDSKKEARIDADMMSLKKNRDVVRVERKERFPIVLNGIKICVYEADWTVYYKNGTKEVFDAKGVLTPVYKLKKKLMRALFNIEIKEL